MSTNYINASPAYSTGFEDEPQWTASRAAVHAAFTLQLAADMHNLLDCTWTIAMNPGHGVLYPLAAFGEHPNPHECARRTFNGLIHGADFSGADAAAPSNTCSLLVHGRTAGVLALGPKRNARSYTSADQNLLSEAAAQVGALLEDERLSWRLAAKILHAERTQRELNAAREVQSRFLPARFPTVKGIDYYGECEPSGEVGGDFFDFTALPGNGLAIAIGGVSTQGVPAAIVMAALQSALRGISAVSTVAPAQVVADLNQLVCDLCPDDFYATLFYARISADKSSITYVNAGHEPALLVRPDRRRVHRLSLGGTVLGLTRQSAWEQTAVPLEGGDALVAFTDRITEEEDGADRVIARLRACPETRARDLVMEIMHETGKFRGPSVRAGDRTAVAARIARSELHSPLFSLAAWEREAIGEAVAA
jgi:serine phosphatase RsbU (regulator of sigma subunit)